MTLFADCTQYRQDWGVSSKLLPDNLAEISWLPALQLAMVAEEVHPE